MPDMVLEIIKDNKQTKYRVSLCCPNSVTPFVAEPYITLSYCWGGEQPYQTTNARIVSRDLTLNWDLLPKTIQDAIKVTKKLGYRFLWVDSLCIPQDDENEKQKQIAKMPQIYSKSTITLVASRAECATDGFLQERDLTKMPGLTLMAKLPFVNPALRNTSPKSPGHVTKTKKASIYIAHLDWRNVSYVFEPLDLRGWALQERYLSTRVLEYGTRQVSWRCAASASDQFGCTDGWHVDNSEDRRLPAISIFRGINSHEAMQDSTLRRSFYDVVEAFTMRKLSICADRILAISGIANNFQAIRGDRDEYLVGLWSLDMPSILLWRRSYLQVPLPRPMPSIAPSWSWAAIEGQVSFDPCFFGRFKKADAFSGDGLKWQIELARRSAKYGAALYGEIAGYGAIGDGLWFGHEWSPRSLAVHGLDPGMRLSMQADAIEDEFDHRAQIVAQDLKPLTGEHFSEVCLRVYLLHVGYHDDRPVGLVLRKMEDISHSYGKSNDVDLGRVSRYSRLGTFRCIFTERAKLDKIRKRIEGWTTQGFVLE